MEFHYFFNKLNEELLLMNGAVKPKKHGSKDTTFAVVVDSLNIMNVIIS